MPVGSEGIVEERMATLVHEDLASGRGCPSRPLRGLFVQYDAHYGGSPISGSMVVKALVDADWQVDAVFGSDGPMTQRYEQLGCRIRVLAHGQFLLEIFRRRMPAHGDPAATGLDDQRMVHVQRGHGRAADCCPTDDFRSVRTPMEVLFPRVLSRVEQGRRFPRHRVRPADLGSLEFIARVTREAEVLQLCGPAARCWDLSLIHI